MENKYQDQVYHFKGLWDLPSICGLKIIKKAETSIIIATDLYDNNPGTSITEWNTKLAWELCNKFELNPENLIFIEHTPNKETKLEFNRETFFKVNFTIENGSFVNPVWNQLTNDEVDKLISE
ncbi:MAG: hypothetical protein A2W99_09005 [Bacteroidetes bacterium GWF2_33_16]|nr:MAG: hypothetical protein A2X00_07450 [Bacteroidetes bacterium GWE2_32_14]OFY03748.1 MAG: hypothetical protein A2W99_09005 [Bacteroidetes bacterium GWF2_33_16]